jgi:hypothetical protein
MAASGVAAGRQSALDRSVAWADEAVGTANGLKRLALVEGHRRHRTQFFEGLSLRFIEHLVNTASASGLSK